MWSILVLFGVFISNLTYAFVIFPICAVRFPTSHICDLRWLTPGIEQLLRDGPNLLRLRLLRYSMLLQTARSDQVRRLRARRL